MNEMEIEILVTKILTDENADTIVAKVNREYASSSYENASRLIDSIPVIVREAMKHFEKLNATIHRGLWASVILPTIDVEDKRTRFAVLTPIVMAICPNGTDIGCSATEKDLFNEWKELLFDKKVFSWGKMKAGRILLDIPTTSRWQRWTDVQSVQLVHETQGK